MTWQSQNSSDALSGFYVSVPLQPSEELDGFLGSLPREMGRSIASNHLHVTAWYGGDCPYPVNNPDQHERFAATHQTLTRHMAGLSLEGIGIEFNPAELKRFGRSYGFPVEPGTVVDEIRRECSGIIQEGLGVGVDDAQVPLHASLIKRRRHSAVEPQCYLMQTEMAVDSDRGPIVEVVSTSFADAVYLQQLRKI